jgi:hypothetical protein
VRFSLHQSWSRFCLCGCHWFSKIEILAPCKKSITRKATARLFFEHVWVHFGIPWTVISDRDNRFLNTFWSSLWSLMDTKLTKSIAFHLQIDGKIKLVNMMIMHILHMYISKDPHIWDEILSYVQHSYNKSLHNSIDHNPFRVCLGFQPLAPIDASLPISLIKIQWIGSWKPRRRELVSRKYNSIWLPKKDNFFSKENGSVRSRFNKSFPMYYENLTK